MTVPPDVPAWPADRVFYQVFPDRFARSGRVAPPGELEAWDAPPTTFGFKGGDLFGLADRLDELVDLGIGGIYLNPIFAAASNHRYNAWDYHAVDPLLGGEPAFRALLDAAHDRDIKVVLDGVFNHAGRGFFPFQHVLENGRQSPYRDWFYFHPDVLAGRREIDAYRPRGGAGLERAGYASWWDVPSLPKIRVEHPPAREFLFGVAEHWLRFGIDGWRLDVPADITDATFWPEFRQRVRAVKPDAYLVGEIWSESPEWLRGDRFDALMNYPLGMAILGFASGGRLDQAAIDGQNDYRAFLKPLDAATFGARMERLLTVHDPATTSVQYNLIGSHDAPRARTVLAGDAAALRLALLLLLSLPGTPSIYYGDELGLEGGPDPGCRGSYPATPSSDQAAIRAYARACVRARRDHRALRRGSARVAGAAGGAIALARDADGERALVALNSGREPTRLELDASAVAGLRPLDLPGIATGRLSSPTAIELPAQGALVLV
ncbi:MAG TPA: glycoside hydrolase family 13 protein [Candidatus Limnocylindrales bacterium]|nr:glycoside hydrolase family 13 protein [Candidatus Limnocylindrales bacterium]